MRQGYDMAAVWCVRGNVLRARKRSSERTAMALTRRIETGVCVCVSGELGELREEGVCGTLKEPAKVEQEGRHVVVLARAEYLSEWQGRRRSRSMCCRLVRAMHIESCPKPQAVNSA